MSFKWLDRKAAPPLPYLTLVTSEADYLKAMAHCKVKPTSDWISSPQANSTAHHLSNAEGERCAIIAINNSKDRPAIEVAGLLVHEAVHVVQDYFEFYGERNPASEQQAYAIQAVSHALMAEYARQIYGSKT